MKKITLATIGTIIAIIAGIFTIIEKTPSVIAVISKASASEVPDNKSLDTTRTMAGNAIVQYENVQHKPRGAK